MSTESPQPTDSESIEEQAFENMLENQASRRGVLRGIGATGTAALGVGVVGAEEDEEDEEEDSFGDDIEEDDYELVQPGYHAYDPDDPDTSTFATARSLIDFVDRILQPEDLPEDEIQLHSMAISESEGFDIHINHVHNNLERTSGMASDEARHAIASAWEDGRTEIQAHQDAMQAIRDFYSKIEWNHLEVLNKSMLQLSVIMQHAVKNDDVRDSFIQVDQNNLEGESDIRLEIYSDEVTESTFELTNGNEITVETPQIRHGYYEAEGEGYIDIDQDLLDAYQDEDDPTSYFVIEDEDGEDLYTDLDVIMQSVQVGDDPSDQLDSAYLLDMNEWMEAYLEIEYQSDRITANFDEQLVEDMYELMDSGQLEPSDVRGVNGLFNEYSGDSEVTSSSLNLAIYNRLDMAQPDLETTASMDVVYSGPTERSVSIEDGERELVNSGFVEDESYSGLLYADETPGDGLRSGHSYQIGGTSVYSINGETIARLSPDEDIVEWETSPDGSSLTVSRLGPLGEVVFTGGGSGVLYALDSQTGDILWEHDTADFNGIADIQVSPDGDKIYIGGRDGDNAAFVRALDWSQEILWDSVLSPDEVGKMVPHPDGGRLFVADRTTDLKCLDTTNGDSASDWSLDSFADDARDILVTGDGVLLVALSSGDFHAIDIDEQVIEWTRETATGVYDWDITNDGDLLYGDLGGNVRLFDLDQQEYYWETDVSTETVWGVATSPHGEVVYGYDADSRLHIIDTDNGDIISFLDRPGSGRYLMSEEYDIEITASLSQGIFVDMVSGDEISLLGGILTIESMRDSEGNEIDEDEPQHWEGGTEYDVYDSAEFAEYTQQQTELIEQIENNYVYEDSDNDSGDDIDVDIGWPEWPSGPDVPEGSALVGVAVVALVVVSIAWSVVSDLIPGLGN